MLVASAFFPTKGRIRGTSRDASPWSSATLVAAARWTPGQGSPMLQAFPGLAGAPYSATRTRRTGVQRGGASSCSRGAPAPLELPSSYKMRTTPSL
jgi:hypothetical protein